MKVLLHLGWKSDPKFPDVANLSSYVTDPDARALFDFFVQSFEAGRPVAVPKGVPQERLDALRKAFDQTVNDPEFISAVRGAGFPVNAIGEQEVTQIIDRLYATPEPVLEKARSLRNR